MMGQEQERLAVAAGPGGLHHAAVYLARDDLHRGAGRGQVGGRPLRHARSGRRIVGRGLQRAPGQEIANQLILVRGNVL